MHKFLLFIAGKTRKNLDLSDYIDNLFDSVIPGQYELDIINVFDNREEIEDYLVFCTPTIIRKEPLPVRKIVGDLKFRDKLIESFDLQNKK